MPGQLLLGVVAFVLLGEVDAREFQGLDGVCKGRGDLALDPDEAALWVKLLAQLLVGHREQGGQRIDSVVKGTELPWVGKERGSLDGDRQLAAVAIKDAPSPGRVGDVAFHTDLALKQDALLDDLEVVHTAHDRAQAKEEDRTDDDHAFLDRFGAVVSLPVCHGGGPHP